MSNDADTINAFLDICAPSLSPDALDVVLTAVRELCANRHIPITEIVEWARS